MDTQQFGVQIKYFMKNMQEQDDDQVGRNLPSIWEGCAM